MEASEEGYRFKTLLEKVLREVLKLFYLNILSEVFFIKSKWLFTKSVVENNGSDQNQQNFKKELERTYFS